jgi:hypothetical protein
MDLSPATSGSVRPSDDAMFLIFLPALYGTLYFYNASDHNKSTFKRNHIHMQHILTQKRLQPESTQAKSQFYISSAATL